MWDDLFSLARKLKMCKYLYLNGVDILPELSCTPRLISSEFHICSCYKTNPRLTLRYFTSRSFWYSKCLMRFLSLAVRTSLSNHLQLPSSVAESSKSCWLCYGAMGQVEGRIEIQEFPVHFL